MYWSLYLFLKQGFLLYLITREQSDKMLRFFILTQTFSSMIKSLFARHCCILFQCQSECFKQSTMTWADLASLQEIHSLVVMKESFVEGDACCLFPNTSIFLAEPKFIVVVLKWRNFFRTWTLYVKSSLMRKHSAIVLHHLFDRSIQIMRGMGNGNKTVLPKVIF